MIALSGIRGVPQHRHFCDMSFGTLFVDMIKGVARSGGLLFGAVFMATDYVTSLHLKGKLVYGVALGIVTFAIRYWGSYTEGVSFALLFMNCGFLHQRSDPSDPVWLHQACKESKGGCWQMSKSSNWESTIKPIVVLSVISLIASLLLALVNGMTAPVIARTPSAPLWPLMSACCPPFRMPASWKK